jgi:hypothetical protein
MAQENWQKMRKIFFATISGFLVMTLLFVPSAILQTAQTIVPCGSTLEITHDGYIESTYIIKAPNKRRAEDMAESRCEIFLLDQALEGVDCEICPYHAVRCPHDLIDDYARMRYEVACIFVPPAPDGSGGPHFSCNVTCEGRVKVWFSCDPCQLSVPMDSQVF